MGGDNPCVSLASCWELPGREPHRLRKWVRETFLLLTLQHHQPGGACSKAKLVFSRQRPLGQSQPLEMANCNDVATHRNPCPLGLSAGPTHPWKWAGACFMSPKAASPCVHLSFGPPLLWESPLVVHSFIGWTQLSFPARTRSWGCSVLQSDPQCLTRGL